MARKCVDSLLKCRLTGKPQATCQKAADRCAKQLNSLRTGPKASALQLAGALQRSCGALTSEALLDDAGIGFEGIADRCAAIGVPVVTDPGDVAACVARAFDCAGSAMVRHALPAIDSELARFGLVLDNDPFCLPSTPTPTITATPTPDLPATDTPTPTDTFTPALTPTPTLTPSAGVTATPTVTATAGETPTNPTPTPTVEPPSGCGNAVLETEEQCDFGDTNDGDGCSAQCQFELLIPGGRTRAADCIAEWAVINPNNDPPLGADGLPNAIQTCVDGDPSCDADGIVNDECRFRVALCFDIADPNLPECTPGAGVARHVMLIPRPAATPARNPTRAANAAALLEAYQHLVSVVPDGRNGNVLTFEPPVVTVPPDNCTATAEFVVPLRGRATRNEKIRARTMGAPLPGESSGTDDRDSLRLVCVNPFAD